MKLAGCELNAQVVAKISLSGGEEDAIFEVGSALLDPFGVVDGLQAMLQEYLAWANNAEGNLFQGYGGFTCPGSWKCLELAKEGAAEAFAPGWGR